MGKMTGFLEYERQDNNMVEPSDRMKNFHEFHVPMNEEDRKKQAARCMNCGVPFCQSAMKLSGMVTGCPLHNLIPEWNDALYAGNLAEAYNRLHKTSNFPEFTGRVCPALCEKACMCGQHGDPVTAHENELFIIENAWKKGLVKPVVPAVRSGKKVAVIGAGPSGLAVADDLNHRGHEVTVYEREEEIGGLLMFGIPNMKLDKDVVLRRRKLMEEEGITFVCGVDVCRDKIITAKWLLSEYDAVVLCCGAKAARGLVAEGQPVEGKGIYYAVDFLTETTKQLLKTEKRTGEELNELAAAVKTDSDKKADAKSAGAKNTDAKKADSHTAFITAKGKHVVVVGGGDTGNDCIGTVLREGCKSVTALEMMPEPPKVRAVSNPWPEWPKVLKVDYGHEEAITAFGHDPRLYSTTVKKVIKDKSGAVKKLQIVNVKFVNGKLTEVAGSEKEIPCDLLLIAAGFVGCENYTADGFELAKTPRNTVATLGPDSYHTKQDKIFTAGDMHRGQSLVVWAIAEGKACAKEVDEYLMGYSL